VVLAMPDQKALYCRIQLVGYQGTLIRLDLNMTTVCLMTGR
jgi:hypothetical protein